jgi:catechol 2,3-dioxygenase-like lactoylglutathione lyase family enzyme
MTLSHPTVSAVPFRGTSRIHVALETQDLSRSLAFYRILFGVEPTKVRADYAKLEPEEPPVNLALNLVSVPTIRPRGRQHFGIQVQSTAADEAARARLAAAGMAVRVEEQVSCCYAVQDKVWVDDPDGNAWEVFVVTGADAEETPGACVPGSGCCAT